MLGNLTLKQLIQFTNLKDLQNSPLLHHTPDRRYSLSLGSLWDNGKSSEQLVYLAHSECLLGFAELESTRIFIDEASKHEVEFENFVQKDMVRQSRFIQLQSIHQTEYDEKTKKIIISFKGLDKQHIIQLAFHPSIIDKWLDTLKIVIPKPSQPSIQASSNFTRPRNSTQLTSATQPSSATSPINTREIEMATSPSKGRAVEIVSPQRTVGAQNDKGTYSKQTDFQLMKQLKEYSKFMFGFKLSPKSDVSQKDLEQFLKRKQDDFATREEKQELLVRINELNYNQISLAEYFLGKIKSHCIQNKRLQKQVDSYATKLAEVQLTLHLKNRDFDKLQYDFSNCRHQLQDLKRQYDTRVEEEEKSKLLVQTKIEKLESQGANQQIQHQQLYADYQKLTQKHQELQQHHQTLGSLLKTKEEQINSLKLKQTELEANSSAKSQEIKKIEKEHLELSSENKNLRIKLQQQLKIAKQNEDTFRRVSEANQNQKAGLQKLVQQLKLKHQSQVQENRKIHSLASKLEATANQLELSLKQTNDQLYRCKSQLEQYQDAASRNLLLFEREKQQLNEMIQNERYLHTFQGQILHSLSPEKSYLMAEVQKCAKKQILFTKVIYHHDPFNNTNFHRYIDQHPNFCIIIKLKNNRIIAGFSVSPLSQKSIATQSGIICSLTEKKTFKLYEGKRSVTYDTFFLIFGNSELRLKQGETKFFTNFGIANSFYDSSGEKYTVLSGEGAAREEIYEDFEVFAVHFRKNDEKH